MFQAQQGSALPICRLCFIDETATSLKEIREISEEIQSLLGFEIAGSGGNTPQTICEDCNIQIEGLAKFWRSVKFSNSVWKEHHHRLPLSDGSTKTGTDVVKEEDAKFFVHCHVCGSSFDCGSLVDHIIQTHFTHIPDCELCQVLLRLLGGASLDPAATEHAFDSEESTTYPEDEWHGEEVKQESDNDGGDSDANDSKKWTRAERRRFQCDLCEKLYAKMDTLRLHKRNAHNVGLLTCLTCYMPFSTRKDLNSHIQTEHKGKGQVEFGSSGNPKALPCPDCEKMFPLRELREHQRHVHVKRFSCSVCNEKFSDSSERDHHMAAHGNNQCPVCQGEFPTLKGLRLHVKVHEKGVAPVDPGLDEDTEGMIRKSFVCPHKNCGVSLRSAKRLETHLANNHATGGYPCPKCDKVLETKKKFLAHQYQHSIKLCGICGTHIFRSVADHMRRHEGMTQFKCRITGCGKEFTRNCDLQMHLRTHTGEKPFTCEVCGKKFPRRNKLTVHLRTHTGEKPYKCSFPGCSQAFAQSFDKTLHLRRHTGEKPYECGDCGQRFLVSYQLKNHQSNCPKKAVQLQPTGT